MPPFYILHSTFYILHFSFLALTISRLPSFISVFLLSFSCTLQFIPSFIHFLLPGPIPLPERQLPENLGHLHPSLIRKPCRMIGHSIRRNWPITKCTKIALLAPYTTPFIYLRLIQILQSYFKPSVLLLHRRRILSVCSIEKKGPL